jgi:hypothetical protein
MDEILTHSDSIPDSSPLLILTDTFPFFSNTAGAILP